MKAAQPRRTAILAVAVAAVVAAAFSIAALLRTDSAAEPVAPATKPLRVVSGNGIATGFAVGNGRVVTVSHVLDGPVTLRGHRVRVLRVDRRNDLALLLAPGLGAAAPDVASAADGQHLRVVRLRAGASSSLSVHVRRSIVAHVRAPGDARALVRPTLELSARVVPGDSGAPVMTNEGALAGIVFAASRNRPDTAYAVDASAVMELLRPP